MCVFFCGSLIALNYKYKLRVVPYNTYYNSQIILFRVLMITFWSSSESLTFYLAENWVFFVFLMIENSKLFYIILQNTRKAHYYSNQQKNIDMID